MALLALILIPVFFGLLALVMPTPRKCLITMLSGVYLEAIFGFSVVVRYFHSHETVAQPGWLFLDALSAYHLAVMLLVFCLSTAYAWIYFTKAPSGHGLSLRQARLFACLFTEAQAAMTLALVSNNLGLMWVGIETTTLVTAFLIHLHPSRESLEAMWKYILICSVGVAFAFLGTLLMAAAAQGLSIPVHETMLWTTLKENARFLNPALIKTAFIFILVGYGTKAGLAPLHNWLPDAHSQAPAPVSALFSGFMLNAALYCIMRFLPITETALGNTGWAHGILKGFGLLSVIVAAAFILFQTDVKRLLAFCSVEHMGIIALGLGLGGLGVFAALFHTLAHSLGKTLSFFSAGRLGQLYGTHDMRKMDGTFRVQPVWAVGLFMSFLCLIGIAPFALFVSEFLIAKTAIQKGAYVTLALFLLGAGVIFVGMLGRAIRLFWSLPEKALSPVSSGRLEKVLVFLPILILFALGILMPPCLKSVLLQASSVIENMSAGVMP